MYCLFLTYVVHNSWYNVMVWKEKDLISISVYFILAYLIFMIFLFFYLRETTVDDWLCYFLNFVYNMYFEENIEIKPNTYYFTLIILIEMPFIFILLQLIYAFYPDLFPLSISILARFALPMPYYPELFTTTLSVVLYGLYCLAFQHISINPVKAIIA